MTTQVVIAFAFGIAFVVALVVLAIKFPHPTPFQYNVFRIVLSLAAAGVAAMIPGFITLDLNPTTGFIIRAGGALAVFVMVFFFNPAQLAANREHHDFAPPSPPPQTLRDGTPLTDTQNRAFIDVWNALRALERAGRNLWEELTDFTLSQFADRLRDAQDSIETNALFFSERDYESLQKTLGAADFYLGGKVELSKIRNGEVFGDIHMKLSREGEKNRFVDDEVKRQITQNRRWLTRYQNLLKQVRSNFHQSVAT